MFRKYSIKIVFVFLAFTMMQRQFLKEVGTNKHNHNKNIKFLTFSIGMYSIIICYFMFHGPVVVTFFFCMELHIVILLFQWKISFLILCQKNGNIIFQIIFVKRSLVYIFEYSEVSFCYFIEI